MHVRLYGWYSIETVQLLPRGGLIETTNHLTITLTFLLPQALLFARSMPQTER